MQTGFWGACAKDSYHQKRLSVFWKYLVIFKLPKTTIFRSDFYSYCGIRQFFWLGKLNVSKSAEALEHRMNIFVIRFSACLKTPSEFRELENCCHVE